MMTPWGPSQHEDHIGMGIISIQTAGHGGYFVPPEIRKLIPAPARKTFAGPGWYEEDGDWCLVALSFPHLFTAEHLDMARKTAAAWHSKKVCQVFNIVERPERNFYDEMRERDAARGR